MDPISAIASASGDAFSSAAQVADSTSAQQKHFEESTAQQDTVQLSPQAQAEHLYQGGQSDGAIAFSLNTTTQTVDGYLGLTLEKELQHTLHPPLQA